MRVSRIIWSDTVCCCWLLFYSFFLQNCQGFSVASSQKRIGLCVRNPARRSLTSTSSKNKCAGFGCHPLAATHTKQEEKVISHQREPINGDTHSARVGGRLTGMEESDLLMDAEKFLINGERKFMDEKVEKELSSANIREMDILPDAPQLTYGKFLTMQQKRVVVTFRYTDLPYLRPYYLTFASKLKKKHTDLIIEKRVLAVVDGSSQPIFEVLVDGKIVIGGGQSRERHVPGGRVDVQNTQSVFVSMEQLGLSISKARKKRRPSNLYGGQNGQDNPEMDKRARRTFIR